MSKKIQTVTDRSGREVEVVTRPARKRGMRPMSGAPESVMGAGLQNGLDDKVLENMFALRDLGPQTPAVSLDETKERRFAPLKTRKTEKG